nr:hypothetical protein [Tanacetum cinerariifolium]
CLSVDYTDAEIDGRWHSESNKEGQDVESAKELWDSLESKYMAEDASS